MPKEVEIKLTPEGKRAMKAFKELEELVAYVGFQRGKAYEEDGTDICDIAAWNELGTSNGIDSRPFMRDSVEKHRDELTAFMKDQAELILRGASAEQVLKNIGLYQKGKVQEEITDGDFKENTESTIRRKSKGKKDAVVKPLIDTGHMRQSVQFMVDKRGKYG